MAEVEEDVDQPNNSNRNNHNSHNQCSSNSCSSLHNKVLSKETLELVLEEGEGAADRVQDAPGLTMTTLVNFQMIGTPCLGKVAMITDREGTLDKVVTITDIKVVATTDIKVETTVNKVEGPREVMVADVLKVVSGEHSREVLVNNKALMVGMHRAHHRVAKEDLREEEVGAIGDPVEGEGAYVVQDLKVTKEMDRTMRVCNEIRWNHVLRPLLSTVYYK